MNRDKIKEKIRLNIYSAIFPDGTTDEEIACWVEKHVEEMMDVITPSYVGPDDFHRQIEHEEKFFGQMEGAKE